jgi:catechol 2,3-dioxygenase-like lactoylglutathione lyase family enzyme
VAFYRRILGFSEERFEDDRVALRFGHQKFNLHQAGHEFEPKADRPIPGSADFCLIATRPIRELEDVLRSEGVPIVEGPVERTGANGKLWSIYFRDPDGNLVEVANPMEK